MDLPLLMAAAAAGALVILGGVAGFGALRWRSFSNRVDRRTAKQHEIEASWSEILDEAERIAQAQKQKTLPNVRDVRH